MTIRPVVRGAGEERHRATIGDEALEKWISGDPSAKGSEATADPEARILQRDPVESDQTKGTGLSVWSLKNLNKT